MMEAAAIAAPSTGSLSRIIAFPCLPRRLLLVDAASGLSPGETSWAPSLFWRCELWLSTVLTCRGSHHAQARTTRRQIGHHGEVAIELVAAAAGRNLDWIQRPGVMPQDGQPPSGSFSGPRLCWSGG